MMDIALFRNSTQRLGPRASLEVQLALFSDLSIAANSLGHLWVCLSQILRFVDDTKLGGSDVSDSAKAVNCPRHLFAIRDGAIPAKLPRCVAITFGAVLHKHTSLRLPIDVAFVGRINLQHLSMLSPRPQAHGPPPSQRSRRFCEHARSVILVAHASATYRTSHHSDACALTSSSELY
ncbi:unnamed protein product [Mesocestoides corti]|uniref:Uncharacterized protein n=1 Tax=Mesocestoides corti TaxID=53468 RepID=A0A0R3UK29_MESCO|nr:unnamed protein product [Mesocestoides corti]